MYRNIDGSGNNLGNPDWGNTDEWFLRKTKISYEDEISSPGGEDRPSARVVSNALFAQEGDVYSSVDASNFLWLWGQFVDHDIDLTAGGGDSFNIAVPTGDPYFDPFATGTQEIHLSRSGFAEGTGTDDSNPAQQVNQITSFLDASMVYGSDQERADFLRDPEEPGKLKLSEDGYLPYNTEGFDNAPAPIPTMYLAGDVRANENVALTSMHTLFVREHNRIVDILAEQHPEWDSDTLYQEAKMLVEAEIQSITYNEYLPTLLGENALADYTGYDSDIDPSIANIFATAAFRFGHTQLSAFINRIDEQGNMIEEGHLSLRDAFFNPDIIVSEGGIDPIIMGMAASTAQEIDLQIVDDVRNFLFGPPGSGGFDLASLNIQRGRDHGLPDYNTAREDYGLARVESFADITSDEGIQQTLEELFGTVDNIDVFVGGLAEDHFGDSMLGELFHTILVDQFTRIRDGDSFFFEDRLTPEQLDFVEGLQLSDIIELNTDVDHMQDNMFIAYERIGGTDGRDKMHGDEGHDLMIGKDGNDRIYGHRGDDQLFGDEGNDHLYGDGGNDILEGNAGNDWLFGGHGDDLLIGGAGQNKLFGGRGADTFLFSLNETENGQLQLEDGSKNIIADFQAHKGDTIQFDVDWDIDIEDIHDAATFSTHGRHEYLSIEFNGGGSLVFHGNVAAMSFDDFMEAAVTVV